MRYVMILGLAALAFVALSGCGGAEPAIDNPGWTNEQDIDLDPEFYETLEQVLTKSQGGTNGDADYCNDGPDTCLQGEGDCDGTSQCAGDLVCGVDNGARFGFATTIDFCWPAHCENGLLDSEQGETSIDYGGPCGSYTCPGTNGDASYCSATCLCAGGQGDCDANSQCQSGLVCGADNGAKFGFSVTVDVCWPDHCQNGLLDDTLGETGIDCGGPCGNCLCAGGTNGDADYCTSLCKCDQGEGDCDYPAHCNTGLVCGSDNGGRFGFAVSVDICWPSHCQNGLLDDTLGETSIDCGGPCGDCTCGGVNGGVDFCTNTCPCAIGEGDCDRDSNCDPGLRCGTDNGLLYGFTRTHDMCWGAPVPLTIDPPMGATSGGDRITLHGTSLLGVTGVTVCGSACTSLGGMSDTALQCTVPAHAIGDCDVAVTKPGFSAQVLPGAFRYTGEGSPGIGWCDLQWPPTLSTSVGVPTENVYGQVWKGGVTEPPGAPSGILAQVGYGPGGSDPRSAPGWRWFPAVWNVQVGNNDEFMTTIVPVAVGTFSVAYRFSEDGGYGFLFCDFDPGTGDGFSTADLGSLSVTP